MASSQIELLASYGDKTLSKTRFVAYVPLKESVAVSTTMGKLAFHEGQPVISTDLLYAHDLASQLYAADTSDAQIGIYMVPSGFFVGDSVFTSAFIDIEAKQVSGSPMRYAGARKQLTMYGASDIDAERARIEKEIQENASFQNVKERTIDKENLIGTFRVDPALGTIANELRVALVSLDADQFVRLVKSFYQSFSLADPSFQAIAAGVVSELMLATVESDVMCRIRMLRWQGLKLLGYKIMEGSAAADLPALSDVKAMNSKLSEYGRKLSTSGLFSGNLEWLKKYSLLELSKINVEFEGAELTSMPD